MTRLRRRRGAQVAAAAHFAQAALLLVQPPGVLQVIVGEHENVPPSWIVRVLGIRTLAQGVAESVRPRRGVFAVGVAVDIAHAASMLAAARMWPHYRRAALTSAGGAAAAAVAGALLTKASP